MDIITLALAKKYTNTVISETGLKGKSAYEYAVDGGYSGTEEEFAQEVGALADKAQLLSLLNLEYDESGNPICVFNTKIKVKGKIVEEGTL